MNQSPASAKGMTLLETIIAIGVIAVAIPLVLAATTAGMADRMNAEADTRSAWLAKNVEEQISAIWATPRRDTYLPTALNLNYPAFGTERDPIVFIFDSDLKFIAQGNSSDFQNGARDQSARYLATVYSIAQVPANFSTNSPELSRLFIKIQHPAKAPEKNRQTLQYSVLMPKQSPF